MTLEELYTAIENLDLEILILESVYELEERLVQYNTDQLFAGKRADGTFLPDYSERSVFLGKPEGPIRLYDEGDFYRGFYVVRTGSFPIILSSTDEKTFELITRYGEEIFGLDKESLEEFSTIYLLETLIEKVRVELEL